MEDFVTFNIAKKLKEKGFLEKCFAVYKPYTEKIKFNKINVDKRPVHYDLTIKEFRECYNCYINNDIDAPTISQVLKWLRDEKNITCLPHIDPFEDKWFFYVVILPQASEFPEYMSSSIYNNYEEAALAGIEYALDNLI